MGPLADAREDMLNLGTREDPPAGGDEANLIAKRVIARSLRRNNLPIPVINSISLAVTIYGLLRRRLLAMTYRY